MIMMLSVHFLDMLANGKLVFSDMCYDKIQLVTILIFFHFGSAAFPRCLSSAQSVSYILHDRSISTSFEAEKRRNSSCMWLGLNLPASRY